MAYLHEAIIGHVTSQALEGYIRIAQSVLLALLVRSSFRPAFRKFPMGPAVLDHFIMGNKKNIIYITVSCLI